MEPAVRGARIEPTIVATRLETAFFASQDSEFPNRQTALCRSKRLPPGTEFLDTETGGQKSTRAAVIVGRDRELKNRREESPQKRPVSNRRPFPQFGKTGCWWAQSYANPSPCYFANIRVIFEKNSEPAAESVKNACSTGISLILRQFDIREKQGAPMSRNTERASNELGRR